MCGKTVEGVGMVLKETFLVVILTLCNAVQAFSIPQEPIMFPP